MESEEEDIEFETLHQILCDENESDDDDDEEVVPPEKMCSAVTHCYIQLNKINELKRDQNLSNTTTVKVAKLLNSASGVDVKIPEMKNEIQKSAADQSEIKNPIIYVFCESCERMVLNNQLCSKCKVVAIKNSKKSNYLVHFSLISQIQRLLKMHFDAIMEYKNRDRTFLTDIDDANLFRNVSESLEKNLIALTLNADGASLSNSGGKQLWPIQLYLNCLPPSIRYLPENIIVTTFYFNEKKPSMNNLLFPLCKELENSEIIAFQTPDNDMMYFLVRVLIFSCDSPARTAMQNFVGPMGYYGCPYCNQKGVPVNNLSTGITVRYTQERNMQLRTHDETIKLMKRFENGQRNNLKGIKGVSAILQFPRGFDIINSFAIDYMHGVALGIVKDLIKIWLGKRKIPNPPYKEYKLTPQKIELLKDRIIKLKPTNNFRRLPRSILDIADYKASEVMHCLFYYLRYSVVGLLNTKIVKNFEKLSAGIYIYIVQRKDY